MDRLPVEILEQILEYLCVKDIKSVRLTSSLLARLGAYHLIHPKFLTLPHRNDFGRLLAVSRHPSMAPCVETLEMIMGELNEYHARHNAYFVEYMKDPRNRYKRSRRPWAKYALLRNEKEAYKHVYCRLDLLEYAFKNLPNLKSIKMDLTSCPFELPLFKKIWQIHSTRDHSPIPIIERFLNILTASRNISLHNLSHDSLPFNFWTQRARVIEATKAFKHLRTLKIFSNYRAPHATDEYAPLKGFSRALKAAIHLRVLHIGFVNLFVPQVDFREIMDTFTWPHLQTLGLEGMAISEQDLAEFLLRHGETIRNLQLGVNVPRPSRPSRPGLSSLPRLDVKFQFSTGTLKGLLRCIKGQVKLEKVNIRGEVKEGDLVTYFGAGLYNEDWDRVGDDAVAKLAIAAENLVLRDGKEWDTSPNGEVTLET